jgi:hypothetical protein
MASIIVLFPIGLFLMWLIRRDMTKDPTLSQLWVRRWALIFTLFVAGVTAAGDLIALLTTFLRGEDITLAFIPKVKSGLPSRSKTQMRLLNWSVT